ncbi:bestrophin-like domain [Chitinophaga japonensis]|uniref:DUF4239 domain-containing protein n=1 Tax=Chitinophaga japonensis TaxID=104662 RepID=A0A562ST24_CHIJA|nr:hypothetical protein [Chitinophaga japonensis]TWI84439.1 hypothetical protein LX66_4809 [Chitinophaga japonensis]
MLAYFFYLIIYPLLLLLSAWLGRITAARSLRKGHQWKPLGLEGGLLGFYALLVSFTLVQSGTRAHERDEMVHAMADDISEILRVAKTYDPALHNRVKSYFVDFYNIFREQPGADRERIEAQIDRIDRLDDVLDADLQRHIARDPSYRDRIAVLMSRTDRMESTYYRLMHSYHRTVPRIILMILMLFSLFIGFLAGFMGRYYGNHIHIVTTTFAVMSIVVLNVIHDLNSPAIGYIRPDFQDITEVMRSFHLLGR